MRQNSIGYPGERAARRADIAQQAGYTGKNHWIVTYGGKKLRVRAADKTAALYAAAKHWGFKWTRAEYHQTAQVDKLPYTPDYRPGALA